MSTEELLLTQNLTQCPEALDSGKKFYRDVAYVVNGHVSGVLIICGELWNLLTFLALYSHYIPRPSIYLYLMGLAAWDMVLLAAAAFLYSIPTLLNGRVQEFGAYAPLLPFANFACNTALIASLWMIVTLTVDRYVAICHPLKHRRLRKHRLRHLLILVSALAALYSLPMLFDFHFSSCLTKSGEAVAFITPSVMRKNYYYRTIYKVGGGLLCYSVLPLLLLLLLTLLISLSLKLAAENRSAMMGKAAAALQSSETDYTASNRMLLAVICKFILSHLLPTSLDVAEAVLEERFTRSPTISFLVDANNLLVILNHSTNFWLYLVCSGTFRADCVHVLHGHLRPQRLGALKAAGPYFRRTLKWQGALFVGREMTTELSSCEGLGNRRQDRRTAISISSMDSRTSRPNNNSLTSFGGSFRAAKNTPLSPRKASSVRLLGNEDEDSSEPAPKKSFDTDRNGFLLPSIGSDI